MLKKTITYKDFNDEEVTEDFFFHLSKAELIEIEMSHEGGLSSALQRIVAANDTKTIIAEFKNIILTAYGQKSMDGRRFIKNQKLRDEFESSEAYSTLFMELVTNTDAAIDFINGIIPSDMKAEIAKVTQQEEPSGTVTQLKVDIVPRQVSRKDIEEMSEEDLRNLGPSLASGEAVIVE